MAASEKQMVSMINVVIQIRLNADIPKADLEQFINELEYEITDTTGKASIESTEIIEFEAI